MVTIIKKTTHPPTHPHFFATVKSKQFQDVVLFQEHSDLLRACKTIRNNDPTPPSASNRLLTLTLAPVQGRGGNRPGRKMNQWSKIS